MQFIQCLIILKKMKFNIFFIVIKNYHFFFDYKNKLRLINFSFYLYLAIRLKKVLIIFIHTHIHIFYFDHYLNYFIIILLFLVQK